ncbi:MAG: cell division protein ZapE [Mycobacteriaceae bacterium]|nr:cell division protein ZapE [Mycobacteriaceae bacterium]
MTSPSSTPARLADRNPVIPPDQLVAQLVPPPMFDDAGPNAVSFDSYLPDPGQPSQAAAVAAARTFAERVRQLRGGGKWRLFGKGKQAGGAGLYLDGGFGVGKTHLLASIYHGSPAPKSFGTFVELTHLVGALGFNNTVERLAGNSVLCIDEFELDDPGDTMLVSRLLSELTARGVSIAATSNTLPGQLGEGRFAAQDFLRVIKKLAGLFETIRVDGPDYRHRDLPPAPEPISSAELAGRAAAAPGATLDDFDTLLAHLERLHPSRYGALVDGVREVFIDNLHPVSDQAVALRMVVLADRLYDASIPVTVSGAKLDEIFTADMLDGGYRKKYLRATSRLLALSRFSAQSAA